MSNKEFLLSKIKRSGKTYRAYHLPSQKVIEPLPFEINGFVENFKEICLGNCPSCKDHKLNQKIKTLKKNYLHFELMDYYCYDVDDLEIEEEIEIFLMEENEVLA